jgi:hypothetical protein
MDALSIEKPAVSLRDDQKSHRNAELRAPRGMLWGVVIGGIVWGLIGLAVWIALR